MNLPDTYTDINETDCCAIPNIEAWDEKELEFQDQQFIRLHTRSLLYVPLNMGSIMKKLNEMASKYEVMMPAKQVMILSRDLSPWKAEQLYRVTKPIDGADNVTLNGIFLTKIFEGPYKNAKTWYQAMQKIAVDSGRKNDSIYLLYTTCPKCSKHYGKNYTIGLVKVS